MATLPHTGSWGLPDWGWTEKIGSILGSNTTNQGGSDVFANKPQVLTPPPAELPNYEAPVIRNSNLPTSTQVQSSTPQVQQSGGQNIDQQMNSLIDDQYNSQMGILNQAGANLATSRQTQLSGLETGAGQYDREMSSALEQALATSKSQKSETELSREKALSENRRNLVNTQQGIMSRFGMGASTGGALVDIATESFFKTQGSIFEKGQAGLNAIFQAENQANEAYRLSKQKINEDLAQGKKQIEDDYMGKILQIESQKVDVGNYRSQVKEELLNQAKTRTEALADQAREQSNAIDLWLAQFQAESTGSIQKINDLKRNLISQSYSREIQNTPQASLISQNAPQSNMPSNYKPLWGTGNDEFDNELNPYA